MALVRCQDHPPRSFNYAIAVEPYGFPDTALICGREYEEHTEKGWVYLLPDEYEEFQAGKRVFDLWGPESTSDAAKVRVSDQVVDQLGEFTNGRDDDPNIPLKSQSDIDRY